MCVDANLAKERNMINSSNSIGQGQGEVEERIAGSLTCCVLSHKKLRIHSHKPLLMCVDANLISQERNMINSVNSIGHSRAPQREVEEWTARSLSCCVLSHKKLRICFSAALFLFGVELPNCLYSAC